MALLFHLFEHMSILVREFFIKLGQFLVHLLLVELLMPLEILGQVFTMILDELLVQLAIVQT